MARPRLVALAHKTLNRKLNRINPITSAL